MKILICDHDDSSLRNIISIIRKKYADASVDTAHNSNEFLSAINTTDAPYNIIFTDIVLGNESGISLSLVAADRFPNAKIIFYCADSKKAELIYVEIKPYAFVNKPFNAEIIYHHIDKISKELSAKNQTLELDSNRQHYSIDIKNITYIESNRNKITIHTPALVVSAITTLKGVEQSLDENFIKCHKSYIVNLAFISDIDSSDFILATGDRIPISRANLTKSRFDLSMYKGSVR